MKPRHPWLLLVLACIACDSRCLADSPATAMALSPVLRDLFERLNSEKFADRESASQQLANYGQLVRPALIDATRTGQSPELRSRAAQLLCSLSWAVPEDSPLVRQALTSYASTNPEYRAKAIVQLGLIGAPAFEAFIRLLHDEPNDEVRWSIVHQLHAFTTAEQRHRLQQLDISADDAPLLAASGWAWLANDLPRGEALLNRAADLAVEHPARDLNHIEAPADGESPTTEVQRLLRWLSIRGMHKGDYDAAVLRTRQAILHGDQPLSDAMLDLFVIHAEHGPRLGFDEDVRLAEKSFYSPEMMYVMGRLYARQNQPLLATTCYRAAALSALSTQGTHIRVARFLLGRRWFDLAQIECEQALATSGSEKPYMDADAHMLLSHCAAWQGDDAKAANCLESALRAIAQLPRVNPNYASRLRVELDWHLLRVASGKHDQAAMPPLVNRLIEYQAPDPRMGLTADIEIDVIRALKSLGRKEEAARRFNRQFDEYRKQLEAEPFNAEILNNIAWFCARCEEKREEAVGWSAEAIRLAPVDSAYLDTAAEAAAQAGQAEVAARYEERALRLLPGDRFMMAQWVRFKSMSSDRSK